MQRIDIGGGTRFAAAFLHPGVVLRQRLLAALAVALTALPVAAGAQSDSGPRGLYLGDLSWPEARIRLAEAPVVILPFGAGAKEHGPHLPMNADQVVMSHLLEVAVAEREVIVAPPVLYGWFPAFRDFPGTEIRDPAVFESYIREAAQSLVRSGARRILFLNTGIDKATGLPISIAAREVRTELGVPTLVVNWGDLETPATEALQEQQSGGHADEIETSINLFLQPELVQMDRAVTDYGERPEKDYGGYLPGVLSADPTDPNYAPSGIYGDATLATAEKGRAALEIMEAEWLKAIDGLGRISLERIP
ncbi:MAG: creatininase family protein [Pseudomonadota bacterium]